MEQRYKPGVLGQLDLRNSQIDLPVSGGIRYDAGPDGSRAEIDLNKTFEGRLGSVTPSIGYTDEIMSMSDGPLNIENTANTIRVGLDGQTSIGPVDLQGSAMGSRTRSNTEFIDAETGVSLFNDPNTGTFTKIAIAGQLGMFNASASREKRSGSEVDYSGNVGMNIGGTSINIPISSNAKRNIGFNVGNGGRLNFSDDGTVGYNFKREFQR